MPRANLPHTATRIVALQNRQARRHVSHYFSAKTTSERGERWVQSRRFAGATGRLTAAAANSRQLRQAAKLPTPHIFLPNRLPNLSCLARY